MVSSFPKVSGHLPVPWDNTARIQRNIVEEIARLKQQPGQDIRVAGSTTLVHPILMENGKRFFFKEGGMPAG
jgi:translation elongation factor EF-Tu-like GTPase